MMTPPPLLDGFAPPVAFGATAGIYTAARLPTLDEARSRRRSKRECTCVDGSCDRCFLDEDHDFNRSQDI